MKAIVIREPGAPEGLEMVELADPNTGGSGVLVEVEAIGVGGVDAVIRRGSIGSIASQKDYVPGSEVAGRVVGVAPGVDPSWMGKRVWAFTGVGGAYAQLAAAQVSDLTELPDDLSAIESVTLGSAATVAWFALEHAHFAPGESVLIRGAAGSIGISAVQLAAGLGAGSIAVTASSDRRGERLTSLGATRVLPRSGQVAGDDGFDVIVDMVSGADTPAFIEQLAANGRMVSVGIVGGYPPVDFGMALQRGFQRSLTYSTFSLNTVEIGRRNHIRAQLFERSVAGELTGVVHEVLPLAQAVDAHAAMDRGEVFGRIVLVP